ncbi:hypothetical protein ANI_1_1848074 [Paecilomyces variotii No. 5]|uniref:Uncharacterized protein n=1 Tax=Byssochlamys spectabilis (strain No. 5 / NBRC 109023) TaxID=1356009 RepID=V5G8N8_BYSSN|nr:hypothetical protein ANI_1_1848074 [Paecilomyces variotii No. 5]
MRSGLQTPGVIPLLALVVFALLSVVPTASKAWESSSERPKWLTYHLDDLPRAFQYLVTSNPLQRWLTLEGPDPRMEDDASILDIDTSSQTFCIGDDYNCFSRDAVVSPSPKYRLPQVTVSESTNPRSFAVAKTTEQDPVEGTTGSVTVLSGTLRSLRTLVSESKDSRLGQLLPRRAMLSSVFSGVTNSSYQGVLGGPLASNSWKTGSKLDANRLAPGHVFPLSLCETWQQVCHLGAGAWGRWTGSSKTISGHHESIKESQFTVHRQPEGSGIRPHSSRRDETADSLSKPSKTHLLDTSSLTPSLSTTPTEQQNVAAGASTSPKEMRGSCMAIVIGLVVGIMWF